MDWVSEIFIEIVNLIARVPTSITPSLSKLVKKTGFEFVNDGRVLNNII